MLILPAIDLIDGKCVRLIQGDYSQETQYNEDPIAVARSFEEQGATWLHVVDLDGAKTGVQKNLAVVESIAKNCNLKIELGGGIRSEAAARAGLSAGAERVIIGTKVVQDPDLAQTLFSSLGEQVVAGLDARNGIVAVEGWIGESEANVEDIARWVEKNGAKRIILTDISKDGMMSGPNLALLELILKQTTIPIIQSGGISSLDDLTAVSNISGRPAEGAIIGKAIYEKKLDLAQAVKIFQIGL